MTLASQPGATAVRPAGTAVDVRNHLAVALDFPSARTALDVVDRLAGACLWLKVGLELYYAAGNGFIPTLRARGFEVFLDLKLHDIPNTVSGAVRTLSRTGASLLTLHAAGGEAMMRAAAEAAAHPGSPRLLAVTVLTSLDSAQLQATGISGSPAQQVLRLAQLARASGISGVVCSAEEVAELRDALNPDTFLVVPGIRPAGADLGDQSRVATPAQAMADGASMLVVGRPITRATDPAAATRDILAEIGIQLGTQLDA
jgi:orotidine-5'-phosphate decarboxylase